MTRPILLLPEEESDMQSPIPQHEAHGLAQCRPSVQEAVGMCAQVPDADAQREAEIVRLGREMIRWHKKYEVTGFIGDLGKCHKARVAMETLIKGRSAGQVAKLERERGLA
jgi:hypothetical protein